MALGLIEDQEDEGLNAINVVPMVDIMLVLLIIFMVSTEFVQHQLRNRIPPHIPVELPMAASGEVTEPSLLSLVMTRSGAIFLNGAPSDMTGVKAYIDEKKQEGVRMQAVVAADERVSHGAVIELIDVIRLWGIDDFAINTRRQEIE